ncbi:MAG: cytochrome c [Betaproteobacteria bacterium]|nr:cytochrome c [Betaproteobacteria bacterium]
MTPAKRLPLLLAAACFALPAVAQGLQIPKPSPGLMPNPAAGKSLYGKHCASCHGMDLKGTDKGPPFLHRIYEPSHHGNAAFQLAVKNGVRAHHWKFGDMPPVPGLTPDEAAHVTAFVRVEQRRAGIQ